MRPAEWSVSQGHTDVPGAGAPGTGGHGTASTPSAAPGSLEHAGLSAEKSTYVEGSTFLQSMAAAQHMQHAQHALDGSEEEEEEEEEEVGESDVLVQGGSMQLNSEPQHLV